MKDYFVHELGCCETLQIGSGTRIWAFAHVLPGARIGADCNLCDHVLVENDVVLGDRVTVKSGVQLWDGVELEDDVFIGPNATFTNDLFPRSKQYVTPQRTRVCKGASVGAGATILSGLTIGRNAMVGAGSVVTHSVPPNAIVVGNPARITGYVNASAPSDETPRAEPAPHDELTTSRVRGVTLRTLPLVRDLRGSLSVAEFAEHVPFEVNRYFVVFDVETAETRGEHAHRSCHQLLVCLKGSLSVVADDGSEREQFQLQVPNVALHLPPMTWGIQYQYSPDAVLLVLASHAYDAADYIRDYDEFLERVAKTG